MGICLRLCQVFRLSLGRIGGRIRAFGSHCAARTERLPQQVLRLSVRGILAEHRTELRDSAIPLPLVQQEFCEVQAMSEMMPENDAEWRCRMLGICLLYTSRCV